jgi:hypothetical protein
MEVDQRVISREGVLHLLASHGGTVGPTSLPSQQVVCDVHRPGPVRSLYQVVRQLWISYSGYLLTFGPKLLSAHVVDDVVGNHTRHYFVRHCC